MQKDLWYITKVLRMYIYEVYFENGHRKDILVKLEKESLLGKD